MRLTITIQNIDPDLAHKQKLYLFNVIAKLRLDQRDTPKVKAIIESLDGVISLLDAITDEAEKQDWVHPADRNNIRKDIEA